MHSGNKAHGPWGPAVKGPVSVRFGWGVPLVPWQPALRTECVGVFVNVKHRSALQRPVRAAPVTYGPPQISSCNCEA